MNLEDILENGSSLTPRDQMDIERLVDLHDSLGRSINAMVALREVEADRDYWKARYQESLNDAIKTSEETSVGLFKLIIGGHIK